jgi:lycopene cyclase CruA
MLNTFFGLLADEPPAVADTFIKDRVGWLTFNRLALKAARRNPALLPWIWEMAGAKDLFRWLGSYLSFTGNALVSWLLRAWFPGFVRRVQPWLEDRYPALWLRLLAQSYGVTAGMGRPERVRSRDAINRISRRDELVRNSSQSEAFDPKFVDRP